MLLLKQLRCHPFYGNLRSGPLLAKFESVMQNLIEALNNGDRLIEIA